MFSVATAGASITSQSLNALWPIRNQEQYSDSIPRNSRFDVFHNLGQLVRRALYTHFNTTPFRPTKHYSHTSYIRHPTHNISTLRRSLPLWPTFVRTLRLLSQKTAATKYRECALRTTKTRRPTWMRMREVREVWPSEGRRRCAQCRESSPWTWVVTYQR